MQFVTVSQPTNMTAPTGHLRPGKCVIQITYVLIAVGIFKICVTKGVIRPIAVEEACRPQPGQSYVPAELYRSSVVNDKISSMVEPRSGIVNGNGVNPPIKAYGESSFGGGGISRSI